VVAGLLLMTAKHQTGRTYRRKEKTWHWYLRIA